MAKRYKREVILKDPRFSKYQKDFLSVVLSKQTYTLAEAERAVKAFFREGKK